ncbi:peroxisomal N(1)-acetyl-spermine/spermidine oxidase-like [Pholidichthys leucotaenia]
MAHADPKIVIIGCGISGVAAAQRLHKSGFRHIQILEATDRSGGRIKSGRLGNNITEIGACYIHGPSEENPVFCLARDYGLLGPEALNPENQIIDYNEYPPYISNWLSSSGERLSLECVSPAVELFHELLDNDLESENLMNSSCASVGHFIRSEAQTLAAERWKDKDENTRKLLLSAISTMMKAECCSSATYSMDDIDLRGFYAYKSLPGVDCTFPRGFDGLIEKLMSEFPSDLVKYNWPVRCVHWNDTESAINTVIVECEDGEKISADHVVVTVPLGYLKKHHSTLFCPPLPAHKLKSIEKLGFGTCNKIFVEFESPWWDADCEVIYLLWKDEESLSDHILDIRKSWIKKISTFTVITPSERGSHVLCGWISGLEAEHIETLPEQEVSRSITELVRTFTGNPDITPKRILCSRWFHDPWTCGSYCHPRIGCSAEDFESMMEPLPASGTQSKPLQVLFAGEATHPCYYSTVHGALLSGWREADQLITIFLC